MESSGVMKLSFSPVDGSYSLIVETESGGSLRVANLNIALRTEMAELIGERIVDNWNLVGVHARAVLELRNRLADSTNIMSTTESNLRTEAIISADPLARERIAGVPELFSEAIEKNLLAIKSADAFLS